MHSDGAIQITAEQKATTSMPDLCPSWFIKEARPDLQGCLCPIINASLAPGLMSSSLKEAIIWLLLIKPNLDLTNLDNFHPLSNVSFIGKVIKRMVPKQLQWFLEEAEFLDPFQFGHRLSYGM